ncbi:MAG: hypothetical protein CfP315_0654 [Candidatus Improbicoccus pseudotrichonymphae]|uniref:Uncharacterized protein n=1 Tax=Candidatus Improbicoccus pseudotrichonymphae TaxID=3033792 RepID=A0AA48HVE2_9FIRM|nr:MAG: hypothetical protein CfP315_0654 [Candidatus Improbicoccus pseudotrichonymphae]
MKNKFIKSLMNSLNSRERERERGLSGDLSMKKESNGIGENKNSKKISKNNKIISSILAVVMCCQSFVGAVSLNTDGKVNVVEPARVDDMGIDDILFEYVPISEYKGEKCEELEKPREKYKKMSQVDVGGLMNTVLTGVLKGVSVTAIAAVLAAAVIFLPMLPFFILIKIQDYCAVYSDALYTQQCLEHYKYYRDYCNVRYSIIDFLPSGSRPNDSREYPITDFYPFFCDNFVDNKKRVANLKPVRINLLMNKITRVSKDVKRLAISDFSQIMASEIRSFDDYASMISCLIVDLERPEYNDYDELYNGAVAALNELNERRPQFGFSLTNAYLTINCGREGSSKKSINFFLPSKLMSILRRCECIEKVK